MVRVGRAGSFLRRTQLRWDRTSSTEKTNNIFYPKRNKKKNTKNTDYDDSLQKRIVIVPEIATSRTRRKAIKSSESREDQKVQLQPEPKSSSDKMKFTTKAKKSKKRKKKKKTKQKRGRNSEIPYSKHDDDLNRKHTKDLDDCLLDCETAAYDVLENGFAEIPYFIESVADACIGLDDVGPCMTYDNTIEGDFFSTPQNNSSTKNKNMVCVQLQPASIAAAKAATSNNKAAGFSNYKNTTAANTNTITTIATANGDTGLDDNTVSTVQISFDDTVAINLDETTNNILVISSPEEIEYTTDKINHEIGISSNKKKKKRLFNLRKPNWLNKVHEKQHKKSNTRSDHDGCVAADTSNGGSWLESISDSIRDYRWTQPAVGESQYQTLSDGCEGIPDHTSNGGTWLKNISNSIRDIRLTQPVVGESQYQALVDGCAGIPGLLLAISEGFTEFDGDYTPRPSACDNVKEEQHHPHHTQHRDGIIEMSLNDGGHPDKTASKMSAWRYLSFSKNKDAKKYPSTTITSLRPSAYSFIETTGREIDSRDVIPLLKHSDEEEGDLRTITVPGDIPPVQTIHVSDKDFDNDSEITTITNVDNGRNPCNASVASLFQVESKVEGIEVIKLDGYCKTIQDNEGNGNPKWFSVH